MTLAIHINISPSGAPFGQVLKCTWSIDTKLKEMMKEIDLINEDKRLIILLDTVRYR